MLMQRRPGKELRISIYLFWSIMLVGLPISFYGTFSLLLASVQRCKSPLLDQL